MVHYNENVIEEIKNVNDIVDVISQYVTLKRMGRNYFGLCPFHKEKSPSFSVSADKQIFHCFGCGVGGNVIHFISKIENVDFKESISILAERGGVTLPKKDNDFDNKKQYLRDRIYEINKVVAEIYHKNLYEKNIKEAQEYVKSRKLGNSTLKSFMIGYSTLNDQLYKTLSEKGYVEEEILSSSLVIKGDRGQYIDRFRGRLMFPIQDIRDRIIGFGGRVLDKSLPKYINSPENMVYSKGRHLYGLNVAKKLDLKTLIIVEGYMDCVSLHQRGVTNVVASLGTALTEAQGRLLNKYSEKLIIAYDSDIAGVGATLRGLEILDNMGSDVRVLEIEEAKDPDEYVIKYGTGRFNLLVEKAISLVEFKVKNIKKELDLNNTNDKIKFLNEIAGILSKVQNTIELEIYIDKISREYGISKNAILGEVNKLKYGNNKNRKILENSKNIVGTSIARTNTINSENSSSKREKMIIYLLINNGLDIYNKIKEKVKIENIQDNLAKEIITRLYEELEKGNSNISKFIDLFQDEELINYLTGIMAEDFEITDIDKCIEELLSSFSREKLIAEKNKILSRLSNIDLSKEEVANLEKNLNDIIIKLARNK